MRERTLAKMGTGDEKRCQAKTKHERREKGDGRDSRHGRDGSSQSQDFIKDERGTRCPRDRLETRDSILEMSRRDAAKVYMKDLSSLASQRGVIGGVQIAAVLLVVLLLLLLLPFLLLLLLVLPLVLLLPEVKVLSLA